MSKILPRYRRCFYTHSKSIQTLSSRKCAGIVVTYEGLIYHETYNEPWLCTRWRCHDFIPVEKGVKCRNILRELMYMIMTNNKGYFWTWPFKFICYKIRPNPFTLESKIRILTKQTQKHTLANSTVYKDDFGKQRRPILFCWFLTKVCINHLASPLSSIIHIPLFEGDKERIFSWPGWVLGEGGMRRCIRKEFDQCIRTQLGLPTLWSWQKNYPSFGWITNDHSQTP